MELSMTLKITFMPWDTQRPPYLLRKLFEEEVVINWTRARKEFVFNSEGNEEKDWESDWARFKYFGDVVYFDRVWVNTKRHQMLKYFHFPLPSFFFLLMHIVEEKNFLRYLCDDVDQWWFTTDDFGKEFHKWRMVEWLGVVECPLTRGRQLLMRQWSWCWRW